MSRLRLNLRQMKYVQILERLLKLFTSSTNQDGSIYITCLQERLSSCTTANGTPQYYQNYQLERPDDLVREVSRDYPSAAKQLITAEDEQFLLSLFSQRNPKPVLFIPVPGENFDTYFKKDSLWQSEDVEALVDQDVQRTCILQGPTGCQYSNISNIDEPVKVILDTIHEDYITHILREFYNHSVDAVPIVEYFGTDQIVKDDTGKHNVTEARGKGKLIYTLPSAEDTESPNTRDWFRMLAGNKKGWRHALFMSDKIVQGLALVANPMRRIFTPRHDLCVLRSLPKATRPPG